MDAYMDIKRTALVWNVTERRVNELCKTGRIEGAYKKDGRWFVGITPHLATAIWTGGEVRSIHFRNMTYGQGAAQALPIFGYFMRSVYSDTKLKFPRDGFERPASMMDEEIFDCSKFQQEVLDEEEYYDF